MTFQRRRASPWEKVTVKTEAAEVREVWTPATNPLAAWNSMLDDNDLNPVHSSVVVGDAPAKLKSTSIIL